MNKKYPCFYWLLTLNLMWTGWCASAQEGASPASGSDEIPAPPPEMVVEVRAKKRITHASMSSTEVTQQEIASLPQGSEVSLPKLITMTTPGVVGGAFGQMFFRGNHSNIQYQLDGVQLPDSPSNTFGQALGPRNIDRMEVITGGFPAEFGQRLSAVVNVTTLSGPETPGGEVQLNYGSYNTFTPHVLYGGSDSSGQLHYFFSANYNRTDRGLDTPQPESEATQGQGGKEAIHDRAYGNSEFAKIDWYASNTDKFHFIFYHSQSKFQIPTFPSSFSSGSAFFQTGFMDAFGNQNTSNPTFNFVPSGTDDTQSETNAYGQVVWKHSFSPSTHLQVAPYYRYSLIDVKNDPANDLAALSLISGATPSSFAQNRHVNNLGLKSDLSFRPHQDHSFKVGFQAQAARSDGWFSIQTNPAIAPVSAADPTQGYFQGVFVQDEYTIFKPLILNAGLRFDAAQFTFGGGRESQDSLLQPRVGLTYLTSEISKVHLYYGKLFQPAPVENLRYSYSPGALSIEPFDLKAEKDDFVEAGVAVQFLPTQAGLVNVYYKDGTNIMDDHQLLNTSIAQPYSFARGFAYGVECSIKGQLNEDWSEYINYSYSVAKAAESAGGVGITTGNLAYQVMDHIQTHTANAGVTYAKNSYWWTLQGLYGSGLRTGPDNSIGLPGHFTMDTTVGYAFKNHEGLLSGFKVSGDVLNIFDNAYPITIANGFNGSHYAAGRQYFIRLTKAF